MKLGFRLMIAPVCSAAVLLAAGQTDAWMQSRAAEQARTHFSEHQKVLDGLRGAEAHVAEVHAGAYRTMSIIGSLDDAAMKQYLQRLDKQLSDVSALIEQTGKASDASADVQGAAQAAVKQLLSYRKQVASAMDMASVDANTGVAAMQSADASFKELAKTLQNLAGHKNGLAQAIADSAGQTNRLKHWLLAGLSLLLAGFAISATWWVQRRIVRELHRASTVATSIAQGQLDVQVSSDRRDELGDLLRALGHMTHQLQDTLQSVQTSAASIRSASTEIASGNADLSQRTEQTAGHLQQTSSSMTQLSVNVNHSAQSSATASDMARSAAEVAQRGGVAVGQVVATMDDIQSSSRKIADIISTIDGIAFQTNILALNAAVEAARAGEQGRGFAVVAGEVRLLAQRSAEAAREIKALIGASVDKVEAGSRLVKDAGATIEEVVTAAQKVASLISEINAGASEQSSGIAQVTGAVNELDRMTQQNAALVEESAAASASMSQQADQLAELAAKFQFSASRPATSVIKASQAPREAPAPRVTAARAAPASPAAPVKPRPSGSKAVATATAEEDWATF